MKRHHSLSKKSAIELSRRRLLRGLVSSGVYTLTLPPLDFMLNSNGTAFADGSLFEPFFGIFFWGNGIAPGFWVPQGVGTNWNTSESLKPFDNRNLKSDITVVSGMSIHASAGERGHHAGSARILSGAPYIGQAPNGANYASTFSAPSIDQQIARVLPQTTQFKSLELGVIDNVTTSEGTTLKSLSHNGPNSPNDAIFSESEFFHKVFSGGGGGGAASGAVGDSPLEKLVVDTVIQDAADLRKQIGVSDQHRLDQHLEHLYDIQSKLGGGGEVQTPPSFQCGTPAAPQNNGSDWAKKSRSMAKILAMAMACRKSRVFTIQFSGSVGGYSIPGTNQKTNYHDLTHQYALNDMRTATLYAIDQFSKFVEEMKAISVGAGNLLDHAAILATSDCTNGQRHDGENYPILIAGRAGGRLRSGLHVSAQGEHTNKVLLTLAQAVGANISSVGVGNGLMTQGLSAIKT